MYNMSMNIPARTTLAFTIVELLIVIVIIGILAAISIVAFNGVQKQAKATKNQAALSQYKKMFAVDDVLNDANPSGAYTTTCLGQPGDYPQTSVFPAGSCMVYGSDVPYVMQGPVMASGATYDAIHKGGRPSVDASLVAVEPDWISLRGIVLLTGSNTNGTRSGFLYAEPKGVCFAGDQSMATAAAGGSGNPIGWWAMSGACWSEINIREQ
jgi:prepilin-type N-terminal cleavage/methylation domain-containing protein